MVENYRPIKKCNYFHRGLYCGTNIARAIPAINNIEDDDFANKLFGEIFTVFFVVGKNMFTFFWTPKILLAKMSAPIILIAFISAPIIFSGLN